jgi:signal transduction histidine kinase/ligand-binding sensor domain-containing protein
VNGDNPQRRVSAISRAPRHGRAIIVLAILLARCPSSFALDPSLDISQYAHTAWKSREGFFNGGVRAIAQTPDGYLWLGTAFGLLRFDGVRSVPWQSPTGEQLPSSNIVGLLAARDGTLWIGTFRGLASWKDGKLIQYHEMEGQSIHTLLQDREGTVWAGTWATPTGRLCEIHGSRVSCHGEDGSLGLGVLSLYEDSSSNLWAGAATGLWRWRPGPPKLYSMPEAEIRNLSEGDNGAILISMPGGIRQLLDGKVERYLLPASLPQFKQESLLRDRDGGLWIGTQNRGLLHIHQGKPDVFAQIDGLSAERTLPGIFEDHEGTIWVGTTNGLDRFRNFAATTISGKQGLSEPTVESVLAAKDGSVWLNTLAGLYRLNNGKFTIYRKHSDLLTHAVEPTLSLMREVVDSGMPDNIGSLFQDDQGRIWVFSPNGVAYFETDRFTSVSSVPGGYVHSVAGDEAGDLWISEQDHGLYHLLGQNLIERIPWAKLGRTDFAYALSTDPARGGVWLGFYQGGLAYFRDGEIRASYQVADGLGKGTVTDIRLDSDGTLWAATEGGLSRLRSGHVATLTHLNGLPCDAVNWVIEDDSHAFWLDMPCGVVRIGQSDLRAWDNDPERKVRTAVFGTSDGVTSRPVRGGLSPQVAKTADGKLWFIPGDGDGVSIIDPRHLPRNELPPPVHVEQITADRKTYDTSSGLNGHLRLPPLIRDLEIDYTALSLVAPEKNQFRYKLEGQDRDWQGVGARRQAFYNDLPPGNYRFRVVASNNSGVWNEQGAALDFSIAPAYWQTLWFRAACAVAFAGLIWALFWLRSRQIAREFEASLEGRVAERTRIARELHDTLLQNLQGLVLRFRTVQSLFSTRPEEARQILESAIDQAREALTEGRQAVQGLRSAAVDTDELSKAIRTLGEELARDPSHDGSVELRLNIEGTPRALQPLMRDEIYRITGEALRNAFRHSEAKRIEVQLGYSERRFDLRVRDDGKGIDPGFLSDDVLPGHYGLRGMRERAKEIGGTLTIWSAPGSGTELQLSVPGTAAYLRARRARRSWLARKFSAVRGQRKS